MKNKTPAQFVAFLRGINVGGNVLITMADLKKAFASLGFTNIRTILASGNVVFAATPTDRSLLTQKIEQTLQRRFGFQISVTVRSEEEIQVLLASEPFRKTRLTPQTKLHVTFLPPDLNQGLKVSETLKASDFESCRVSKGEVCSAVEISPGRGTTELMKVLEGQFGKKITTRTWNTVERIGKALES